MDSYKSNIALSRIKITYRIAAALITYILIGIFKFATKIKLSLHQLLIWIKHNCNVKKKMYRNLKPPEYDFPIYEFALHTSGGKI